VVAGVPARVVKDFSPGAGWVRPVTGAAVERAAMAERATMAERAAMAEPAPATGS